MTGNNNSPEHKVCCQRIRLLPVNSHLIISFLLFFLLLCQIKTFSRTIIAKVDSSSSNPYLLDLKEILGIQWVLLPIPANALIATEYHMRGPHEGWAVCNTGESRLWRRTNGFWTMVQELANRKIRYIYAIDKNNVWAAIESKNSYKDNLMFFDGGTWQEIKTPNSDQIRDLFFLSPNSGWAGCIWGQIMRFDGLSWKLADCPTPYHIQHLIMVNDSLGYATIDYQRGVLLQYSQSQWNIKCSFSTEVIDLLVFSDSLAYIGHDRLLNLNTCEILPIDIKSVITDTIQIHAPLVGEQMIWVREVGYTRKHYEVVYGHLANYDPNEVVHIHYEGMKSLQDWNYYTYHLFSQQKFERVIVLKSLPRSPTYLPNKQFLPSLQSEATYEYGICAADFSNDGIEDYYVVVTGRANRLFVRHPIRRNIIDDVSDKAGVLGLFKSPDNRKNYDNGASSSDIDNDGDQDLLVTSLYGPNLLFKQIRKTSFQDETKVTNLYNDFARSYLGIWGDVNNDGFIDLFVCNADSTNHLYLNNGAGVFSDVTREAGLYVDRGGAGGAFADIDNDGDLDLFVSRYGQKNLLYRNEGLRGDSDVPLFVDVVEKQGVAGEDTLAKSSSSMFADFDNDGDLDLFVTNLVCSNWLYLNDGKGHFTDVTPTSGLQDNALSQMAVYLDADHDGDLDIYVGNRGANAYYENQGNATFINSTRKAPTYHDGYTTGLAVFDLEGDGDMDIYLGEDSQASQELKNMSNNANYLKLRLRGSVSNRDAIGAKVYLYESGHLGEKNHLLGMHQVHGGYGHNSMSSRIVHFGIPDGQAKDVFIVYPSGIRRELHAVEPGQTITVYEETGWTRRLSLLTKWVIRNIKYPPNQREVFYVLSFFVIIFIVHVILSQRTWWQKNIVIFSVVLPLTVFVILFITLRNTNFYLSHVLPLFFGCASCGIGIIVGRRLYGRAAAQSEFSEKLFLSANAFFHGEWGARKLNRLLLYCSNLQPNRAPSPEVRDALSEAINDYFSQILPEVERIISYADGAGIEAGIRSTINSNVMNLTKDLTALKTAIHIPEGAQTTVLNSVTERVEFLQTQLRSLRKRVAEHFTCDVYGIISNTVENLHLKDIQLDLNSELHPGVLARIRAAELSQIMDNLIDNAIQALKNVTEKSICITLNANADFVFVCVSDSGAGIPVGIKDKLFEQEVTTKIKSGGFGLFRANQVLRNYGGSIRLVETPKARGTTFELQLKRVDNA